MNRHPDSAAAALDEMDDAALAAGFPAGFLWGAATSAYQIEGAPLADGAGPSIWHRFAHTPGRIQGGDTGDRACDHYHRLNEDLDRMADLGLSAYRFSVAWGRVLPDGRGWLNPRGLGFYERLVDGLLARGIVPMLTLYHWDLPTALQDRGGWLHPDSPGWFADYAALLVRALGDRVPLWVTLNEPWVVTVPGHLEGTLAPGWRDPAAAPRVAHHLLLAHAEGARAARAAGARQVGLAVNLEPQAPATPDPADRAAAARRAVFINQWFLDPPLLGTYPDALAALFGDAWPDFPDTDLRRLQVPTDFIGVNYYSLGRVRADAAIHPVGAARVLPPPPDVPQTTMGWEVHPEGLTDILTWLAARYGNPPVHITENGAAFADPPPVDGEIPDAPRVDYLRAHLHAARSALERGVDLRGYFVWSLLDNFEWAEGYRPRFGLFGIAPGSLERIPKRSARWYRGLIRSARRP